MNQLQQQSQAMKPSVGSSMLQAIWPLALAIVLAVLMFKVIGPASGGFATRVMLVAGINIVLAVSLTIVNGFTGQFSMGHAGFMVIGGYVTATIVYYGSMRLWGSADFAGGALSTMSGTGAFFGKGDLLFVGGAIVGGLMGAAAGYLVGLPSLRLRGDYLAIVTLGFGEIVIVLFQATKDQVQPWRAAEAAELPIHELALMLGGPKGFNLLPTYTTLFWVYLLVGLTLILVYRLKASSSGRAFLSIREDEVAAQAMGVNVTKYKVRAFVFASFLAGVAGGLYAMDFGAINATELGFQKSFEIIIMVVLGGMGSISGAALAAIILTVLPEILRDPPPIWPAGLAVLAVMVIVQAKRGHWNVKSLIIVAVATVALEVGRQLCVRNGINIADYRLVLYALMLILMMILRPDGLFGVNEIWDYLIPRRRRLVKQAKKLGAKEETP